MESKCGRVLADEVLRLLQYRKEHLGDRASLQNGLQVLFLRAGIDFVAPKTKTELGVTSARLTKAKKSCSYNARYFDRLVAILVSVEEYQGDLQAVDAAASRLNSVLGYVRQQLEWDNELLEYKVRKLDESDYRRMLIQDRSVSPQLNKDEEIKEMAVTLPTKVFVVHGRDEAAKLAIENMLRRYRLEPVILHRQANAGRTLIEKFEDHSDVDYAIVLLTPDDVGKCKTEDELSPRARQNVVFELGYFFAKLGRRQVACVYEDGVDLPTDISGIAYVPYQGSAENAELPLVRELKAAGLNVVDA